MKPLSKTDPNPRDKAEMMIAQNQAEGLKKLLAGDRCKLAHQRRKGKTLEHLCKEKPELLAVVLEAKARAEKI
jgi:hypothetical protein